MEPHATPAPEVLLVEDNPTDRKLLELQFRHLGVPARIASDGTDAVELFRQTPFRFIVMDCVLPGLDGMEATALMRAIEKEQGRPRATIVAVTSYVNEQTAETCLAAGMDHCVTKPYRPDAIARLVLQHGLIPAPHPAAPPTHEVRAAEAGVNLLLLREIMGIPGNHISEELASIYHDFKSDFVSRLDGVASWQRPLEDLAREIHQIKGLAANFGFERVAGMLAFVESSLVSGIPDKLPMTVSDTLAAFHDADRFACLAWPSLTAPATAAGADR